MVVGQGDGGGPENQDLLQDPTVVENVWDWASVLDLSSNIRGFVVSDILPATLLFVSPKMAAILRYGDHLNGVSEANKGARKKKVL